MVSLAFSPSAVIFIPMISVRTVSILVAGILIGSTAVFAQDAPRQIPYEPDHLIPVRDGTEAWKTSYSAALRAQLRLEATFFARMVISPAFDGESCLRLHGPEGEPDITKVRQFFLTSYQADQSIWETLPESEQRKPGPVIVSVSSAPVPAAFARRLLAIWDEMLARTSPPAKPSTVLDGVSYEFSTPEHTGMTYNPMQRLSPQLFTELGRSLMSFCAAKPEHRARLLQSAKQHATVLENYLKAHPVK